MTDGDRLKDVIEEYRRAKEEQQARINKVAEEVQRVRQEQRERSARTP